MDSEKLPERLQEVSPERLSSHPLKKGNPRDHWRLEHVEQKVLESGLVALQSQLTASPSKSPAARQGSAVLRASFFERLLEGHVELKACPANDVAAAQGDLKKLNLSQLLALRILTKDFPTTSVGSLKVHGHFLAALSSELFQKVGARAMGEEIATRKRLEQIGARLVLCLGAAELLAGANPAPPCCWLTALEEEDSSSSFVLVDVCAHSAQIMEGISGDFDQYRGVNIAVVIDLGSSSSLNWEVITMDAAKDDIPAAMTVLRARRRRKGTRRTTVEETPEDSARHFPSLPFATEELVPKSKREDRDAEASSTKGMEWPATSPPRNSREREGGYKDYPFITDIFDYFGCCTRRRDESHA